MTWPYAASEKLAPEQACALSLLQTVIGIRLFDQPDGELKEQTDGRTK